MLTSISPLGEQARGNRWAVTAAAYVAGSLLGGASLGALLGFLGPRPLPLAAAAACALAAVADLAGLLPRGHRQVDEDWLTRYRGWVYGLGFGYQLGMGVVTIVTSASTYAALAVALFSGSAWAGAAIGGTFGLVRALPLLTLRRARTPAALRATGRRLDQLAARAGGATAVLMAGAAAALAATA